MKYSITKIEKNHVNRHFGESQSAGSRFRCDLFPTVESVFDLLLHRQPINIILQNNNTEAHEFLIEDNSYIGWLGLGLLSEFESALIQKEMRNGYETKFIEVDSLPTTNFITVISSPIENTYFQIITLFPGQYAPAFPNDRMSIDDFRNASEFWDTHILLKCTKPA